MTPREALYYRLQNQLILPTSLKTPAEVAKHMLAMQAQDYPGALWSVGLRSQGATMQTVEQAIETRQIVRTWPMRGTLHFLAADDVRWMTQLLAPRVVASLGRRHESLNIDKPLLDKTATIFRKALTGGKIMTRNQIRELLESEGISTAGQRGTHIMYYHAQTGMLCFGPHQGKQPTFTLLDEWLPKTKEISGDEAFAELALRYFTSHGPATVQDLVWWAGAKVSDIKKAVENVRGQLMNVTIDGKEYWMGNNPTPAPTSQSVYLLPGFDEYMLGYKDRGFALEATHAQKIVPGYNGVFLPTIVSDGKIVGLWKRTARKHDVTIELVPFVNISKRERRLVELPAQQYGAFTGLKPIIL